MEDSVPYRPMPLGPVEPTLDLRALEARVQQRWDRLGVPAAAAAARAGSPPWIFYEGPPTANGRPGLHHVWARVFKDIFPRFQTMRGHEVPRKGGWDCHGLPVELEVERELGLTTKAEIEAYGIAEFNERCRSSVERYVADWTSLTVRSGTWIDTDDAYWTLSNDYVESVWWLVRRLWDRGALYEGHRVSPYCGRCGTALSSHEVAQGYSDVVDPSVYVRFTLLSGPAAGASLAIWTTTPWTLVSNVAAAVGDSLRYVRLADPDGHGDLVLGAAAAQRRYPDARVLDSWTGAQMTGWRYRRPLERLAVDAATAERAFRVVAADYVSDDDGTGIVHLAPAFGEQDAAVGRAQDLPALNPVGPDAAFDASVPSLTGRFVKDADRELIAEMDQLGSLIAEEPYEHSYPHCWRCGTPLIYWAKTSWFARTSEHRSQLLANNEQIGWHPEHIRHGRFGKWLEGNVDWALSRDRYWGTPLPIWRCTDCGTDTCIGSIAELSERAGRDLDGLDLHRPFVDEVELACAGCGGTARRVAPVLDAWFDSGSMPSAQHHHPFEGAADPDGLPTAFPADFICEAIDQTRGWFYSLLAVNTLAFDMSPYRNVVCLGHIVDQAGQKMSKSKGNVIDPWRVFDEFGADALRWYFFSSGQPWSPRRVFDDGIRESTRQTLVTLWNVVAFHCTYADLDGWSPGTDDPGDATHVLDRWILSELDDTVGAVTDAMEDFDALGGATRLATFLDDLSNWYVRRSRPRFWKSADPLAHATLHHCLVTAAELLAPFCPFLADEIHTVLSGSVSVHLADWPTPAGRRDEVLAGDMAAARHLVALGRSARTDAKVRVRQPLSRALLVQPGRRLPDEVLAEVAAELNVHALETVEGVEGLLEWTVVPNFAVLGPRLGSRLPEVRAALAAADGSALRRDLERFGAIEIAGERLGASDVEVRARRHESFALAEDSGWAVALDLALDDALLAEGMARELVRTINDHRRAARLPARRPGHRGAGHR